MELSTNQKGAIAETAITAAAVRLGIDVYRPVSDGGRYDLILDTGERLLRTQCKWANREGDVVVVRGRTCRHTPRGYVFGTYRRAEVDGVAAWCPDTEDAYFVPIERDRGPRVHPSAPGTGAEQPGTACTLGGGLPARGYSSAGRAFGWQPKGRGFESP